MNQLIIGDKTFVHNSIYPDYFPCLQQLSIWWVSQNWLISCIAKFSAFYLGRKFLYLLTPLSFKFRSSAQFFVLSSFTLLPKNVDRSPPFYWFVEKYMCASKWDCHNLVSQPSSISITLAFILITALYNPISGRAADIDKLLIGQVRSVWYIMMNILKSLSWSISSFLSRAGSSAH